MNSSRGSNKKGWIWAGVIIVGIWILSLAGHADQSGSQADTPSVADPATPTAKPDMHARRLAALEWWNKGIVTVGAPYATLIALATAATNGSASELDVAVKTKNMKAPCGDLSDPPISDLDAVSQRVSAACDGMQKAIDDMNASFNNPSLGAQATALSDLQAVRQTMDDARVSFRQHLIGWGGDSSDTVTSLDDMGAIGGILGGGPAGNQ